MVAIKIPMGNHKCQKCGNEQISYQLFDREKSLKCNYCGAETPVFISAHISIGEQILHRGLCEFNQNKDYDIAIIFFAMAVEYELTHLYIDWSKWDELQQTGHITLTDEDLEENLREFYTIKKKFQEIPKILYPNGIENFIQKDEYLSNTIANNFKSINVNTFVEDVQRELFGKRNRILHVGDVAYTEEEATRCHNIARLAIIVLRKMDEHRRHNL